MRLLIAEPFLSSAVLLSAAMLLAGCDSGSKPAGQAQPVVSAGSEKNLPADINLESANGLRATLTYEFAGQAAPTATFAGADNRDVSLGDFAGRPLLINIWATWCAPCKAEMPTIDALAVLEKDRMKVIVVSQDLEGKAPVQAFFRSSSITDLEPYVDPENALLTALGNNVALPTTILYNSDGREVWRVIGGVEWDDAGMAKFLTEAS